LCRQAGLVTVGVIAIDGTKMHANASQHSSRDYEQIAREILEEAAAVDAAEDELYGDKRGDELPEQLTSEHGRRAWFREAKRRLDEQRAEEAKPIPQSRPKRLKESKRRLEEELWSEQRANAAYEAWRARGVMADGRKLSTPAKPYVPPEMPAGKVNVTDPDSRNVKTPRGYMQGYNAQAVVGENQIVIAAEVNADSPDFGHLEPMVTAAEDELEKAGVTETPEVVVADPGYWHQVQMENVVARDPSDYPAGRAQARRRQAGMGRWAIRVHAPRRCERDRWRVVSKAPGDDRACVRAGEVQPQDRSVPTKRPIRRAFRVAINRGDAQPP
jgi:hypothetical protein